MVALYLIAAGGVLYFDALEIFYERETPFNDHITDEAADFYYATEWAGCLISVVFLVCTLHP